ncbi:putative orphan protein [Pseudoalteromonas luteoviolacea B = ATCC 29581]|nr:putative orphan protein [Pseudoalteromonas luteoviolacea B = ATCC 29581]
MSLTNYLATHFYTESELCDLLKIEQETLQSWQANKLFPKPSYCIQNHIKCSSYLGFYECEELQDFYSKGSYQWGQILIKHKIAQATSAFELFAQQYTNTLAKIVQQGVEIRSENFNESIDDQLHQSWQQFLCSKYGVISQNGLVEEVVYIDLGRELVDEITEERTKATLSPEERAQLIKALKLLNRGLSHNAAHEKHESLRAHYVDAILQKYDLSIR